MRIDAPSRCFPRDGHQLTMRVVRGSPRACHRNESFDDFRGDPGLFRYLDRPSVIKLVLDLTHQSHDISA